MFMEIACAICSKTVRVKRYRAKTARYCSKTCQAIGAAERRRRPIADRFWAKVKKAGRNQCWVWTGATTNGGYGVIGDGRKKLIRASHLSYELHIGRLLPNQQVLHRCDNPPCVNPRHLFTGTPKTNAADKVAKGRCNSPRKLSDDDVSEILRRVSGGEKKIELAREFNITRGYVTMLVYGRRRA